MMTLKKQLLSTSIALSLLGIGVLSQAHAETTIDPVVYDTIVGENGQFIDLESDEFLLHQEEWYTIQAYTEEALRLPITQTSMINAFAIPDNVPFTTFQALLDEYKKVYNTADNWNRVLYPDIVNLALQLSNYADTHAVFFAPLLTALNDMSAANSAGDSVMTETHRQTAISLLNVLKSFAASRQADADQAEQDLIDFAADLSAQSGQLDTLRGTHAEYLMDDGSELKVRIAEIQTRIEQLNREYDKYVTIAATTVTYAWVPVYGILAAVPVAGIYGDKAERARKERNQLKEDIKALQADLTYRENIYTSYQQSYTSIIGIEDKIRAAIPHVNKLKGHWQDISSDFDSVIELLDAAGGPNGLENALALVASISARTSLGQVQTNWQNISAKASKFAQNAYITVADESL